MEKGSSSESGSLEIKFNVKFNGRIIPVKTSVDSTIKDLKEVLLGLTDVLPRGQKLICKGRILGDPETLRSAGISNGSSIMLLPTIGLHQGEVPLKKDTQMAGGRIPVTVEKESDPSLDESKLVRFGDRVARWKATGVIVLGDNNLKAIPEEVWDVGSSARVLDVSYNFLRVCPAKIGQLTSIQKLLLDDNEISAESISWEGLASLKSLAILSLNQNHLRVLPSALGFLKSLKNLDVGNNQLTCLPTEICLLRKLEVLKANNNRLIVIPSSIGSCRSLVEVDLSSNLLNNLPDAFEQLKDLKALRLSNNVLKSLPSNLLKMCVQLSTLEVHGTNITTDMLRGIEGWEDFDTRRKLKHQKQLDFGVKGHGELEFDEGADKE